MHQMVRRDAEGNRYIERVFDTKHRDMDRKIASGNERFRDSIDFVAENEAKGETIPRLCITNARYGFLEGDDLISLPSNKIDGLKLVRDSLPWNGLNATESRLFYLPARRITGVAAEENLFNASGITRSENGTHIVEAAYILQQDRDGMTFVRHVRPRPNVRMAHPFSLAKRLSLMSGFTAKG